jgi:hypothetical protein
VGKQTVAWWSPSAGAALDPPLWAIVPNKALFLSLSLSLSLLHFANLGLQKLTKILEIIVPVRYYPE